MDYLELGLLLFGVFVLVIGYRRNHRNLLLVAAIMLFLAGTAGDFARGFAQGIQQEISRGS